jgi:pimeloyl-ACP methyl ester carboxylesterase
MHRLVLIPGLLCDERLWGEPIATVAKRAEISVAEITGQSTIAEMGATVLKQAPRSFCLGGFSLGSQVALEIMRVCPERVERLALLSATHGGLLPAVEAAIRQAVEVIEQEGLDRYLEQAYPGYVAPARVNDERLKRTFMEMGRRVGKDAGVRQMHALLSIKAPFGNVKQIRCPTLILGGREDRRTTPEAHQLLNQEIRGSQLVMVEDAGHFTPLEQPGMVAEALQRWMW